MRLQYVYWLTFIANAFASSAFPINKERDLDNRIYFAVEIDPRRLSTSPEAHFRNSDHQIPQSWTYEQPIYAVPNHYLFSIPKSDQNADMLMDIGPHARGSKFDKRSPEHLLLKRHLLDLGVNSLEVFEPRKLYKRSVIPEPEPLPYKVDSSIQAIEDMAAKFGIKDPIFNRQWHLFNPVQPGHDINVTGAWEQDVTGKGVSICVIDDGLDLDSKDLKDNFFPEGSWDFNNPGPYPRPRLADDRHGTRCAGEIAAVKNDVCGVGVAYNANIAGVRILSKRILPADEALSINYAMDKNDIYSCSWGPSDNGRTMEGPPAIVSKAMLNAIQNGRKKKGNIYVFASGNGGSLDDNCNFDGYTNSIYSITIAAIDRKGLHPFYSEACSANMVVTYSSGSGDYIHTTDVEGSCSHTHGGTSAAAPIAAGIFSLVLEVNPEITWRDMQYLVWETAVKNNEEPGWQKTPSGKYYHHTYGYGKLDAYGIVEKARTWKNVKPQAWFHQQTKMENVDIPEDGSEKVFTTTVTEDDLKKANLERLEHIQVKINADSSRRGSLTMTLESPSGVKSEIMMKRRSDSATQGVVDWKFMSVAHWGESGVGEWKLTVKHVTAGKVSSRLIDWQLLLWGESIDASKAKPFPGVDGANLDVSTSSSVSEEHTGTKTSQPVKEETSTKAGEPEAETSSSFVAQPTTTAVESSTPDENHKGEENNGDDDEKEDSGNHGFFGSLIPTFGMSKNTAAWVYGSGLIIILFIGGITGYLLWIRRKRNGDGDYKGFNPLLGNGNRRDEELGDELDYLNEFSISDEEDEYSDDGDANSQRSSHSNLLAGTSENVVNRDGSELTAGKKAVDLYSSPALTAAQPSKKDEENEPLFSSDEEFENSKNGSGSNK